ncbi:ATP-binding protein [Streptosporangium longisporum]|uniref:HTH luxR-type domain-containing protein n=1 Tax=Streptosporangium longisporum TaxID=46187 RepID=A0ABN3XPX1_9ACTN
MSGPEVSAREAEVLAALGAGMSNAQIARRMHISVRTVEGHVSSLLRTYGVTGRAALAARAPAADEAVTPPGTVVGLPRSRTRFVGRRDDLDAVLTRLAGGGQVTLTGPGGVGKTRLASVAAEAAASRYRYAAAFVDLVPVRDGLVGQAVAAVLGVSEHAGQPVEQAVLARLRRGPSLLVLDNCEHLPDAVAEFAEQVLATCPTTILATSRERLGIPGERVQPVAPLPLGSDAEELFRDRAELAHPGHRLDAAAVTELCSRLDGLPLAIELAAARSPSLGAAGLLSGLDDHLRLLVGGRGPVVRHRSVRAVIGWSHDLLDEDERAAFRRMSVFTGDFDVPAAAAVTGLPVARAADLLGRLVDKSLVRRRDGGWHLLETIRAFAAEQLGGDPERDAVRRRLLNWAADTAAGLADRLDEDRQGEDRLDQDRLGEDRQDQDRRGEDWRGDFDRVAGDLRAAAAMTPEGPDASTHRLLRLLARLTFARGFLRASADAHECAARYAPTPSQASRDLGHAAEGAQVINDSDRACELWLAAAERARTAGDGNGHAVALARVVEMAGRFPVTFRSPISYERRLELLEEATAAGDHGDPVVAARLACAAAWTAGPAVLRPDPVLAAAAVEAARATGDPVLTSAALDAVRTVALNEGRARDGHRIAAERLALLSGLDPCSPAYVAEIDDAQALACLDAVAAGDLPAARAVPIPDGRPSGGTEPYGDSAYLAVSKTIPAVVLGGDLDEAVHLAGVMWDGWRRAGRPRVFWMQVTMPFVVLAHGLREDRDGLARWRARAAENDALHRGGSFQARLAPLSTFVEARIALHLGELDRAAELAERARHHHPPARYVPFARAAAAELAVAAGLSRAGADLAAAVADTGDNDWAAATALRATGRHDGDPDALARAAGLWDRMGARFEHACTVRLLT